MQLIMCINVLRGRSRPFQFGWVWNMFCYANISVLLPRLLITWPHVGYVLYGGALSNHQKGTSFYHQWHGLWSIETVNSNQGYLLIQIKISQMEKSVLMILMLNAKYIYWYFLLTKVTLEMGKGSVAALLFFFWHGSWLKYRSIPLHTNVSV